MKNLTPIISDATQHVSPSTNNMRIEKDEVLVTSLFCRIFDGNGFNTSRCSSTCFTINKQRESEKMKCW